MLSVMQLLTMTCCRDSGDKEPRRDRKGSTHTKDTSYKDTAHKDTSHNKDTGHKDSGHKDSGHKDSTHKDSTHKEEGSSSKHYNSNTLKKEVFGAHHQLFDEDKSSKDKDNNKKGGGAPSVKPVTVSMVTCSQDLRNGWQHCLAWARRRNKWKRNPACYPPMKNSTSSALLYSLSTL
jgi:hypothetical protein